MNERQELPTPQPSAQDDQALFFPPMANLPAEKKTERQIKAHMAMRGISQKDIALHHGLHPSDVSRVIKGDRKSRKIRNIIAGELGVAYEALWGGK